MKKTEQIKKEYAELVKIERENGEKIEPAEKALKQAKATVEKKYARMVRVLADRNSTEELKEKAKANHAHAVEERDKAKLELDVLLSREEQIYDEKEAKKEVFITHAQNEIAAELPDHLTAIHDAFTQLDQATKDLKAMRERWASSMLGARKANEMIPEIPLMDDLLICRTRLSSHEYTHHFTPIDKWLKETKPITHKNQ